VKIPIVCSIKYSRHVYVPKEGKDLAAGHSTFANVNSAI